MRHSDFIDDDYPEGIAVQNDNTRERTPGEHLAFLIATFVAAAGILYGLALIAQGLIDIFETFGRFV